MAPAVKALHGGIGMTSPRTRARMITRLRSQGIEDETVLAAMESLPRHIFVDEALASRAYDDDALPLGFGQTLSSPYTVARMTELLRQGGSPGRVLEIGTGGGYQAAVLAKLCKEVYTVERIAALVPKARQRLRELRLNNVKVRHGDGNKGWPEFAPFDAILVTAAGAQIPEALMEQLAVKGRIVAPVGREEQQLVVVENGEAGRSQSVVEPVRFVPLLQGVS